MTTAEAVVAALTAHGIATVYALPGIQNDHLFDALYRAQNRVRTVHTRHEQGSAYMALGAALATGKPQACAVVPGPGLLNAASALLTAYSMNAPVLALIGEIPEREIGRHLGHLHELRDQAGVVARLVDHAAHIRSATEAPRLVAEAMRAMASGRRGPAALECAIDTWGASGPVAPQPPLQPEGPAIDEDAVRAAAKRLGAAKNPLIICGGGAQDAAREVTELSAMLQAPVLGYRRGRGVLDSRDPLSVTLPLAHELWVKADVVLAIGTRMLMQQHRIFTAGPWGLDDDLAVIRVDSDPAEPARLHAPAVALIGDAAPILRRLIDTLPAHNAKRR
jgi:acetolactate synthase-1/2/3 large subunit